MDGWEGSSLERPWLPTGWYRVGGRCHIPVYTGPSLHLTGCCRCDDHRIVRSGAIVKCLHVRGAITKDSNGVDG